MTTGRPWYHRGPGADEFPFGYYLHITADESVDYLKAELQQVKAERDRLQRLVDTMAVEMDGNIYYQVVKDRDDLRAELQQVKADRDAEVEVLMVTLAKVKDERDAAVADITVPWKERDAQKFGELERQLQAKDKALREAEQRVRAWELAYIDGDSARMDALLTPQEDKGL